MAASSPRARLVSHIAAHLPAHRPHVCSHSLSQGESDFLAHISRSHFRGTQVRFSLKLPKNYPNAAPVVSCRTRIFHPNVRCADRRSLPCASPRGLRFLALVATFAFPCLAPTGTRATAFAASC